MNYIVTGGCGFLGSHLVDKYLENGYKKLKRNKKYGNKNIKCLIVNKSNCGAINIAKK